MQTRSVSQTDAKSEGGVALRVAIVPQNPMHLLLTFIRLWIEALKDVF
ncbi:hypothetical protein LC608_30105 [Nostoc sp. XA010]|nr:hypothetical protein [Nostoc sp. XA010]MCC5661144.1 hypothetical protein [Nostoc sp. XA010]